MPDVSTVVASPSHHTEVAKLHAVGASPHEIATFLSIPEPDVYAALRFTLGNRACCLEALKAGPASTSEIAARTGIGMRIVSATLHQLAAAGRITRRSECPRRDKRRSNRWCWVYALIPEAVAA